VKLALFFLLAVLDREASCARSLGIPAPESALGLGLRRALPSAQVQLSRLHKTLDAACALPPVEEIAFPVH
jgi:hypothetical protein